VKIRKIDSTFVDSMDICAYLLKGKGQLTELNRISHDLLQANPYRAETWTSISMYYDAKGRKEKAMEHLNKAIDIDSSHEFSYFYRGMLYYSLKQYSLAIRSLETSALLHRNIPVYKSLVSAYLSNQDEQQARKAADDTLKIFGKNSEPSLCLVSLVRAHSSDTAEQDKAKETFLEVLKNKPNCLDAVVGLCTLYKKQEKSDEAIKLLKHYLEKYNVDFLFTAMGDILASTSKYDEAVIYYAHALKLNPLFEPAHQGIETVENLIRGNDIADREDDDANNFEDDND
jgi:tetratricopeptide (TPR) repeat protein